jgi:aminoglycoside phosphotransferase (APT) family kinase protein
VDAGPPTDPVEIARALSETFPELGRVAVRSVLGRGFNSVAVETDGGLVLRIARTEGTAERFARERRLMPVLRAHLPVAVPDPRWLVERSERFPFGVAGYPKLAGRVLMPDMLDGNRQALAGSVGETLLALQRIPLSEVDGAGLPTPADRPADYRSLEEETRPALRERLSAREFAHVERWWASFFADERMERYGPVLVHGDFWFANMLVDDGATRLTGVVDWEHAALGDPALDFSTLLHLGAAFTEQTIEAFREAGGAFDDEAAYRMRRLWELREFYGILYSVRFRDDEEMEDSIRKLRAGPVFDSL